MFISEVQNKKAVQRTLMSHRTMTVRRGGPPNGHEHICKSSSLHHLIAAVQFIRKVRLILD
jgi:hypothetical protein